MDLIFNQKARTALGIKRSTKTKIRMRVSANRIAADPAERKRRSDRAKTQHAEGNFGRQTWSEETQRVVGKKISLALTGHPSTRTKPISEESRERYRLGAIKRYTKYEERERSRQERIEYYKHNPVSDETKQKMRDSHLGKPSYIRTEKTLEKQRLAGIIRSANPIEQKRKSDQAKLQHAQGNFGRITWKTRR